VWYSQEARWYAQWLCFTALSYLAFLRAVRRGGRLSWTVYVVVTALDDGEGKVLQALRDNNLTDNTLIFFLSDNGAPLNSVTSNLPLQGGKLDTLEGGIRVPFAIQWSGHLPAGLVYGEPVSSLDIVATAASAAGR